ncbi:MAG TPA: aminotransferase class I/II-fold pyridoxal phosphate-dependent enzyme [Thermoplasmata archaeon]|nr:aminotransferase class I/II-fold pyridoxal phosphate-dependent enzyme [Thermoplasmata archaeon]
MRRETLAVHSGGEVDRSTGAIAPPLSLSTTFEHAPSYEAAQGFHYIRDGNPIQTRLETALADLEGGGASVVFGSGMAAAAAALQSLPRGSHVLFATDIYHALRTLARDFLPHWGIDSSFADLTDLDAAAGALRPATKLVWAETPSNPLLQILDLRKLSDLAHRSGAQLLVDNTFATPILQQPISLGADWVLHSTTKYCGGHSDVQGGALVGKSHESVVPLQQIRRVLGAVGSPFNSWLILRGLRTLAVRMPQHSANAMAIVTAFEGAPGVEAIHYPGLAAHPGHEVARQQMSAFGGMLSLRVRGGRTAALKVAGRVKLFVNATSLGGVESLIEHRASAEGPDSTTPQNLLRLSVGLEHPEDLIDDLRQALQGT